MSLLAVSEPATVYQWQKQLKIGLAHEAVLDEYYSRGYNITEATPDQQRMGIDRIFSEKKPNGLVFSVDYKSDDKAFKTRNAFIEIVSVNRTGKKGWALASLAQIIIYYIPQASTTYWVGALTLKKAVRHWINEYPMVSARNGDYDTEGLLVPMSALAEKATVWIISSR